MKKCVVPQNAFDKLFVTSSRFKAQIAALSNAVAVSDSEKDEHITLVDIIDDVVDRFDLDLGQIHEQAMAESKEVTS